MDAAPRPAIDPARIAVLQRMPVFGGLREDILGSLVASAKSVSVASGSYYFREGDAAECMYVLEAGDVAVLKGPPGDEHLLHNLGPGDCFGEMALIDFSPRSATVRAVTDCMALAITPGSLHQVYERDVEQFALLEMNMGREVSRRLRVTDAELQALRAERARSPAARRPDAGEASPPTRAGETSPVTHAGQPSPLAGAGTPD